MPNNSVKLVNVVLNEAEVGKLLKSAAVGNCCKKYADKVAKEAGDGYHSNRFLEGRTRANSSAYCYSTTEETNNNLLKALGKFI